MHGHALSASTMNGLGIYYLIVALMNVGFASYLNRTSKNRTQALIWGVVAGVFLIHSLAYFVQGFTANSPGAHASGWVISHSITHAIDYIMGPVTYFVISTAAFFAMLYFRKFLTDPIVGWSILMLTLLFSGWAMTNVNFRNIITKPDNVPIVILIFSVGYLTWLALRLAVINDERIAAGQPPMEKLGEDKVLTWPDLVYTELICMVVCTFALVAWAYFLKAPLEAPASTAKIPNPSKAPWYFLGLQEMLVYFDPWMAGVVLPSMIIVGLIAIPYIDFNVKGNGYYTFNERPFAIITFMYGFIILWVVLIILGTFLRGPNWNFYGLFEPWDPHKTVPLNNINLSDLFWLYLMGDAIEGKPWYIRELPGIILVALYMIALPPLLAKTFMRSYFIRMGFIRFFLLVTLIQFMAALPLKMVLRWTLNLKYIVFIPEYFLNI